MKSVPADLADRDLRLLRDMRSLPDRQLDRAHLAAGLALRRAGVAPPTMAAWWE
ncbi:MAG: hypothetical protein HKL89_07210 [Candidatus Dormibacteraeota bacterium]|nr:hypothetical protein [Candidatus Dormibacteraeota bacterium]